MSWQRTTILLVGPFAICGAAYWFTMPPNDEPTLGATVTLLAPIPESSGNGDSTDALDPACRSRATEVAQRLSANCRMIVRPPFILAGDLSEQALQAQYLETIIPTARALSTLYFDREPDQPIVILLFVSESGYRQHAARFDGRERPNYAGYYQRNDRRIVLNMSTGDGTLAHELTHALAHCDFPQMPEWFDEGLASLVEQSEFSDDQLRLFGVSNWRLNYLLPALKRNQLQSTESLMMAGRVRPGQEAVDYAHARYLCLYLQQRELLGPFYRKFRAEVSRDATGLLTLQRLLGTDSLETFDQQFRQWVMTLPPTASRDARRISRAVSPSGGSVANR